MSKKQWFAAVLRGKFSENFCKFSSKHRDRNVVLSGCRPKAHNFTKKFFLYCFVEVFCKSSVLLLLLLISFWSFAHIKWWSFLRNESSVYLRQIFRKTNILQCLLRARTYQRVRNVSFLENFAYVPNGWSLKTSTAVSIFQKMWFVMVWFSVLIYKKYQRQ